MSFKNHWLTSYQNIYSDISFPKAVNKTCPCGVTIFTSHHKFITSSRLLHQGVSRLLRHGDVDQSQNVSKSADLRCEKMHFCSSESRESRSFGISTLKTIVLKNKTKLFSTCNWSIAQCPYIRGVEKLTKCLIDHARVAGEYYCVWKWGRLQGDAADGLGSTGSVPPPPTRSPLTARPHGACSQRAVPSAAHGPRPSVAPRSSPRCPETETQLRGSAAAHRPAAAADGFVACQWVSCMESGNLPSANVLKPRKTVMVGSV